MYEHLDTEIANTRYVLAAHFLRDCNLVLEVGGSSLHHHLIPSHTRAIWCVDPLAPQGYWNHVTNFRMPVHCFTFNGIPNEHDRYARYGMCLLGLELFDDGFAGGGDGELSTQAVVDHIHRFDTVVFDYVEENERALKQITEIESECIESDMRCTVDMRTGWLHDSKYLEPNESFSKPRRFCVYRRDGRDSDSA